MNGVKEMNQKTDGYEEYALVIYPNGYHTMMGDVELYKNFGSLMKGHEKDFEMEPVPRTKDVYFLIPEVDPLQIKQVVCYKKPAIVVAIKEGTHKPALLEPEQIRAALEFFEAAEIVIGSHGNLDNVFCLVEE